MDMKRIVLLVLSLIIPPVFAKNPIVTLESCIDGDTAKFILDEQEIKVRFLAINAPEIEHEEIQAEYKGEESKEYVCNLLTNATEIVLEYDNNSDITDKYGRVLAWIWVDGKLLQDLVVEEGLAKVDYIYDEYLYVPYLCQKEKRAYNDKKGIWEKNKKLGYCNKIEDNNYTLENLKKDLIDNIDISSKSINYIIIGIILFLIIITILTLLIIKRN